MQPAVDEKVQSSSFNAGEVVVLRWRRNHPADMVMPVRVVADTAEHIALFHPVGTVFKGQATADGRKLTREMPFLKREALIGGLADATWTGNHVLQLIRPAESRSTWLLWSEEDWTFRSYYVNLQAPIRRTAIGFDTADYLLDLVVSPNLDWAWKDREEVDLAREHDIVGQDILDRMEREGQRAIRDIEAGAWPFNAGFEKWRPDPAWDIPAMPKGWDASFDVPFVPEWGEE